jgi:hypothetical protein
LPREKSSNNAKTRGTSPSTGEKLRQALIAVQIKAIQCAAEPIVLPFSVDDLPGLKKLNQDLVQLVFDRKLDARTLGALNGLVANQVRILIGPSAQRMRFVSGPAGTLLEIERIPLREELKQDGERFMNDAQLRAAEGLN